MKNLVATAALVVLGASAQAQEPTNLYPEGNFEGALDLRALSPNPMISDPLSAEEGVLYIEPGDYQNRGCSVAIEDENGSSFLRFVAPEGFGVNLRTYIAFKLPTPAPAALTISQRWRLTGLQTSSDAPEWAGAQNDPEFVLSDGSRKSVNGTFRLKADSGGWVEVEKSVQVPDGSVMVILRPGLYVASGTLDIDDIKVFAE
jgi:hypothetical protein